MAGLGSSEHRPRVAYFYDDEVGNYHYGQGHPMKPHRVRIAHHLISAYSLYPLMDVYRPPILEPLELTRFHTDDYVGFLRTVTPENMHEHLFDLRRFSVGEDCPVFDGMWEFIHLSTSATMGAVSALNSRGAEVAVNWAGGFHHAKKSEARGFCYINDIVLGILELLKVHRRVLYIDIDIHHGDGVEEAFYTTDRVMTVSFHKYGNFFPGTGYWADSGHGAGANSSINFPLHDGMDDESYRRVFRVVIGKVMERFVPDVVVLQCGADSLAGDRLGCFNLSLEGHADCVRFVKSFGLPTLVLGGGGYTMRNVARCWAYETGVVLGRELEPTIPACDYLEYFAPTYKINVDASTAENKNPRSYLDQVTEKLLLLLHDLPPAPSVPIATGAITEGEGALPPKPLLGPAERAAIAKERAEDEGGEGTSRDRGGGGGEEGRGGTGFLHGKREHGAEIAMHRERGEEEGGEGEGGGGGGGEGGGEGGGGGAAESAAM